MQPIFAAAIPVEHETQLDAALSHGSMAARKALAPTLSPLLAQDVTERAKKKVFFEPLGKELLGWVHLSDVIRESLFLGTALTARTVTAKKTAADGDSQTLLCASPLAWAPMYAVVAHMTASLFCTAAAATGSCISLRHGTTLSADVKPTSKRRALVREWDGFRLEDLDGKPIHELDFIEM